MCKEVDDATVEELDVRNLVPAQRHDMIFEHIYGLAFGSSFVLINDHDPKPLHDQLDAEFPSQFSWTCFEEGPAVWRVEIGRREKAAWLAAGR